MAKIFLALLAILLYILLLYMNLKIKYIILSYIFLNIFYSFLLKKIAYWEMFSVSTGFMLRVLAGTILVNKTTSPEFYVIVFFGSLLIISGKRLSELNNIKESQRSVLNSYKIKNIEGIINLSFVLVIGTYLLFIFSAYFSNYLDISKIFIYFSCFPFLVIIFNIHSVAINGELKNPELQFFTNKNLIINALIWISVFLVGVRN
jgi:4-hydroxybenzoate polyprenyltransferase